VPGATEIGWIRGVARESQVVSVDLEEGLVSAHRDAGVVVLTIGIVSGVKASNAAIATMIA
jgi:hypothetical protein